MEDLPPRKPSSYAVSPPTPPPLPHALTLVQPSTKKKQKPVKVIRAMRNVIRSFPIMTPACRIPVLPGGRIPVVIGGGGGGTRVTGTLFGRLRGRVSLSVQENPRTLPMVVLELDIPTHVLQKELSSGMLRISLECEKRALEKEKEKTRLMDEPVWTMYYNGMKNGYGVRREATEEDLQVMEVLKVVTMGTGAMPEAEGDDGEIVYIRTDFERIAGKDSETLYMLSPDGTDDYNLSIYFLRL